MAAPIVKKQGYLGLCNFCNKTFPTTSNVARHMKTLLLNKLARSHL